MHANVAKGRIVWAAVRTLSILSVRPLRIGLNADTDRHAFAGIGRACAVYASAPISTHSQASADPGDAFQKGARP
ncbi:hypothetical protein [Lysobacter gummosus]|uniref:hypothetical protein n=1 Tax=Lysobacter gummosus TaxID=262324 RepID=UPI003629DE05